MEAAAPSTDGCLGGGGAAAARAGAARGAPRGANHMMWIIRKMTRRKKTVK